MPYNDLLPPDLEPGLPPDFTARYVDERTAARILGLKRNTLTVWRHQGRGPEFSKLGGTTIRYRLDRLYAFAEGVAA